MQMQREGRVCESSLLPSHHGLLTPDLTVQVPQQCVQLLGPGATIVQLVL